LRIFDRFFVFGGRFFGVFERFTLSQKTQISQILINIKIKHGLHAIALDEKSSWPAGEAVREKIKNFSFFLPVFR